MSHSIDFHAWHVKKKIMMKNIDYIGFLKSGVMVSDGASIDGWAEVNDGFEKHIEKTIQLIQYSGLNDKYGKKIYEGDIVLYFNRFFVGEPDMYVVEKESAGEGMFPFNNDVISCYGDDYEIIGNIYENPELLN